MMETYKSVLELIKNLPGEDSFKELVEKEIQGKRLAKLLFYLRCKGNFSQKELAHKIGCSQSRISKIEGAPNEEITVKDLEDYAKALGLQVELGFSNSSTRLVGRIKYHAFRIKECLERLSVISKRDEKIEEGVKKFYKEVFVNMNTIITRSFSKFHGQEPQKRSLVNVSAPVEKIDYERVVETSSSVTK